MLDVMYDIPSNEKVNKVVVTLDAIKGSAPPEVHEGQKSCLPPDKEAGVIGKGTIESAS